MSKNLHIACIIPYKVFPPKMGGQKGIACFYEYLSEQARLTMIASGDNDDPRFSNTEFLPVLGNSKLRYVNPLLFFRIRKILQSNRCTHLIIEHPYYGWLGILLKIFCRIPLVIHSHNMEALRFKSTGKWWWGILWNYEKFTHRMASLNFFITDEDKQYAIKQFKLKPGICHTITYGIGINKIPTNDEKREARKSLEIKHHIEPDDKIILFNGTLSYAPNLAAVDNIIHSINPLLQKSTSFSYKIIICGKGLPESHRMIREMEKDNIIFAGFVDDINPYFLATDIFINPVVDGGGIKTKLVESLAYNACVVSSASGAIGIPSGIAGKKLVVCADNDWNGFANAIVQCSHEHQLPQTFFNHFYWGHIAEQAVNSMSESEDKK